jgi:TolB-like protein
VGFNLVKPVGLEIFRYSAIVTLLFYVLFDLAVAQAKIQRPAESSLTGSVAVIPFSNITGDSRDDWIGSGIAETVMASLESGTESAVINPEVIRAELRDIDLSLGSSITNVALLQLGDRLRVRWIIAGGYQHLGEKIRVTGRLIEVSTGSVVRSAKIDGAITELFDVQDRLVSKLVFGVALDSDVALSAVSPELEHERVADESSSVGGESNDVVRVERDLQLQIEAGAPLPPRAPDTISRNSDGGATIREVRLDEDLSIDGKLDEQVYQTVLRLETSSNSNR